MLDGAAHFYRTYETSDGKFVSVGAIEPQFYALMIEKAGLNPKQFSAQHDVTQWPELSAALETVFRQKTRDQWCEIMEGSDVCFAPVLDYTEAPSHPHNLARETYINVGDMIQPTPAPRFSNHKSNKPEPGHVEGDDTESVLAEHGFSESQIKVLLESGAIPGA